jgi:hypothetical protein
MTWVCDGSRRFGVRRPPAGRSGPARIRTWDQRIMSLLGPFRPVSARLKFAGKSLVGIARVSARLGLSRCHPAANSLRAVVAPPTHDLEQCVHDEPTAPASENSTLALLSHAAQPRSGARVGCGVIPRGTRRRPRGAGRSRRSRRLSPSLPLRRLSGGSLQTLWSRDSAAMAKDVRHDASGRSPDSWTSRTAPGADTCPVPRPACEARPGLGGRPNTGRGGRRSPATRRSRPTGRCG